MADQTGKILAEPASSCIIPLALSQTMASTGPQIRTAGPNPGEGVPEPEPGGPNRARDSAALGTVAL